MQFFLTLAAVVAVAVATPVHRGLVQPGPAGPTPIIEEPVSGIAIGPAILDLSPISVGPAIVEASPIAVGPAIIDFPHPDGGVVIGEPAIVAPEAVVEAVATESKPLVQIIVNINAADLGSSTPITVAPVVVDQVVPEFIAPGPVNVVDNVIAPVPVVEPVVVVDPITPGPVNVVDNIIEPVVVVNPIVPGHVNVVDSIIEPVVVVNPVVPGPVNVVDSIIEPVQVGTPIIPAPAVVIPETLN